MNFFKKIIVTATTLIGQIKALDPKDAEKVAAFFRQAERRKRRIKDFRNDAGFRRAVDKIF